MSLFRASGSVAPEFAVHVSEGCAGICSYKVCRIYSYKVCRYLQLQGVLYLQLQGVLLWPLERCKGKRVSGTVTTSLAFRRLCPLARTATAGDCVL